MQIFAVLSHECNRNCSFCYYNSGIFKKREPMLDHEALIGWILSGKGIVNMVNLTGGEPFIYPRIMDLIKELHKYRIQASVATNGDLLESDNLMKLRRYGVKVMLSLTSRHDLTLKKELIREMASLRIKFGITAVMRKKERWKAPGGLIREGLIDTQYVIDKIPSEKESKRAQDKICPVLGKTLVIESNGDLLPCFFHRKRIGNISNTSLISATAALKAVSCSNYGEHCRNLRKHFS